jgi:hypothetical protein
VNEAGLVSREIQALGIEIELALGDASASISTWLGDHRDAAAIEAGVGWWVRSHRFEEAENLANREGLTRWQARFALWRNQPKAALELLARLPFSPEVRLQEAIAAALLGTLAHAESLLRTLLDSDVRSEAWSWLATVLRKQ